MAKKPKKRPKKRRQRARWTPPTQQASWVQTTPPPTGGLTPGNPGFLGSNPAAPAQVATLVPAVPPPDPAWVAWVASKPGLYQQIYDEYGNPALLNDPNATWQQKYGYQGTELARDYGYSPDGSIDPSNPFSKANDLERSYAKNQRFISGSLASQGQGYSSYFQNKMDAAKSSRDQASYGLKTGYDRGLHGITQYALGQIGEIDADDREAAGQHDEFVRSNMPAPTYSYVSVDSGGASPSASGAPGPYTAYKGPKLSDYWPKKKKRRRRMSPGRLVPR